MLASVSFAFNLAFLRCNIRHFYYAINTRVHHANELKPFLQENERLRLAFLPKYSPELNPVEGLWKWLKHDVVNNVFFSEFYHIRTHVTAFMKLINQNPLQVIDRLLLGV
nr:transposase [Paenibacillus puerhi]